MDLTETEAKAFWPIYEEFQTQLLQNNERVGKLIMQYAENYDIMTAETALKSFAVNRRIKYHFYYIRV